MSGKQTTVRDLRDERDRRDDSDNIFFVLGNLENLGSLRRHSLTSLTSLTSPLLSLLSLLSLLWQSHGADVRGDGDSRASLQMALCSLRTAIYFTYPCTASWFTHFKIVVRRASTIDCLT